MALRQFLLDTTTNEAKDIKRVESTFIYLDEEGLINAWITSANASAKSTLKAFKESTAGTMDLQDIAKPDLPMQIIGIESNGCLIAKTGQGSIRYHCTNGRITGLANTNGMGDQRPWSARLAPSIVFRGMQQSDCFSCGELIISRHETIAKNQHGDPVFPQSLLLVRTGCESEDMSKGQQWIAIGSSQFDDSLNLIPCAEQQLFDIPIINFVIDNPREDKPIMLIGWNRKTMQAISINQQATDLKSLRANASETIELEDYLLEDLSKPWINHQGRTSCWRDLANAGQFYTWHRD